MTKAHIDQFMWGYQELFQIGLKSLALGINSPYLWSFSDQWTKGKFVADHKFDPNATSKQCGAAVMLRALVDAGDVRV